MFAFIDRMQRADNSAGEGGRQLTRN